MSELDTNNPRLASQEEWARGYYDLHSAIGELLESLDELSDSDEFDATSSVLLKARMRNWIRKHHHLLA